MLRIKNGYISSVNLMSQREDFGGVLDFFELDEAEAQGLVGLLALYEEAGLDFSKLGEVIGNFF
jgi:hypothetical protein